VIDVYQAASRVTYDIIGQVAIDHSFNTLTDPHGEGGELFEKYERMQQVVAGSAATRQDLATMFPNLEKIAVSCVTFFRVSKLIIAYGKHPPGTSSDETAG